MLKLCFKKFTLFSKIEDDKKLYLPTIAEEKVSPDVLFTRIMKQRVSPFLWFTRARVKFVHSLLFNAQYDILTNSN